MKICKEISGLIMGAGAIAEFALVKSLIAMHSSGRKTNFSLLYLCCKYIVTVSIKISKNIF